jgi:outer membrane biosynthesis protein TonB
MSLFNTEWLSGKKDQSAEQNESNSKKRRKRAIKQKAEEKEKEKKLEEPKLPPPKNFDEQKYQKEKKEILENLSKAVEEGLEKSKKRKAEEMEKKKEEDLPTFWYCNCCHSYSLTLFSFLLLLNERFSDFNTCFENNTTGTKKAQRTVRVTMKVTMKMKTKTIRSLLLLSMRTLTKRNIFLKVT